MHLPPSPNETRERGACHAHLSKISAFEGNRYGKGLVNSTALDTQNLFRLEAEKALAIAVKKEFVAAGFQSISGGGAYAFNVRFVTVFCVNGADGTIFLDESDGEETTFSCGDCVFDFGHNVCLVIGCGRKIGFFCYCVKILLQKLKLPKRHSKKQKGKKNPRCKLSCFVGNMQEK